MEFKGSAINSGMCTFKEFKMTPLTLPNNLWRALSEVKNYVEKFPDGVTLSGLERKVPAYRQLNGSERGDVIKHIEERNLLLVLLARKATSKTLTTFLRHKKYGYPKSIEGYEYPTGKSKKIKSCSKCKAEKPLSDFHANASRRDGCQSYCKDCIKKNEQAKLFARRNNCGTKSTTEESIEGEAMTMPSSPDQLRKQAEELLKAAERAEKNQATEKWKAEFKKEFEQQKLEVMQSIGMANRKFDEMMDAMAALSKAADKLKSLKIE